jgi:hypothetical protein
MNRQPSDQRHGLTIFHGDGGDVMPHRPAQSVDFLLTDPPDLVRYPGRWDGERQTIIDCDCPPGGIVFDPFMGSGRRSARQKNSAAVRWESRSSGIPAGTLRPALLEGCCRW